MEARRMEISVTNPLTKNALNQKQFPVEYP